MFRRTGQHKQKGQFVHLPQRWALQLAIEGDLRFISHLDCMRAIERTASRAEVPLRFTQGFNPHPIYALACPRPVGVATLDDLVVLDLADDLDGDEIRRRMNDYAPHGMTFGPARRVQTKKCPQPRRIEYAMRLGSSMQHDVTDRLDELKAQDKWCIERVKKPKRRGRKPHRRTIDLKQLTPSIEIEGPELKWTVVPDGDLWPRVDEQLRLLGLDDRRHVADVVRTQVQYD